MNDIATHLSLIICLVGLLIFVICSRPNASPNGKRIGEIMFFAGLLAVLLGK